MASISINSLVRTFKMNQTKKRVDCSLSEPDFYFPGWSQQQREAFIEGIKIHGLKKLKKLQRHIGSKSQEDVRIAVELFKKEVRTRELTSDMARQIEECGVTREDYETWLYFYMASQAYRGVGDQLPVAVLEAFLEHAATRFRPRASAPTPAPVRATAPAPTLAPAPAVTSPAAKAQAPATTTKAPAPATTSPTTKAPAPAKTSPTTKAPVSATTTSTIKAPAPATTSPMTKAPAPATTSPTAKAPAPATTSPTAKAPAPATTSPTAKAPAPATTSPTAKAPAPATTSPTAKAPAPATTSPTAKAPAPATTSPTAKAPAPATTSPTAKAPAPATTSPTAKAPAPATTSPTAKAPAPAMTTAQAPVPAMTTASALFPASTPVLAPAAPVRAPARATRVRARPRATAYAPIRATVHARVSAPDLVQAPAPAPVITSKLIPPPTTLDLRFPNWRSAEIKDFLAAVQLGPIITNTARHIPTKTKLEITGATNAYAIICDARKHAIDLGKRMPTYDELKPGYIYLQSVVAALINNEKLRSLKIPRNIDPNMVRAQFVLKEWLMPDIGCLPRGWTKDEKYFLIVAMETYGPFDLWRIQKMFPRKTRVELKSAMSTIRTEADCKECFYEKSKSDRFLSLTSWGNTLTLCKDSKDQVLAAKRLISALEELPEPDSMEDLLSVFQQNQSDGDMTTAMLNLCMQDVKSKGALLIPMLHALIAGAQDSPPQPTAD